MPTTNTTVLKSGAHIYSTPTGMLPGQVDLGLIGDMSHFETVS